MAEQSIILNEKILLKLLKENPNYLIKIKENYFLSDIGKSLFKTYKYIYFDKQQELNNQNIVLYGNEQYSDITLEICSLIDEVEYNTENFDGYYHRLKKEYAKEHIYTHITNEILREVSSKDSLDIDAIKNIQLELSKNLSLIEDSESSFLTYEQMIENFQIELRERIEGNQYSIGCSFLDRKLGLKARPGYITSIIGATGLGKSSYALYLILKQINKNIPCIYFSLENDNYLTTERILSNKAERDIKEMYNRDDGILSNLKKILEQQRQKASRIKNFLFCEEPSLSISTLESKIIEAKKVLNTNYMIVTIDLASMLTDFGKSPQDIESSMNRIHIIARRQNVHFILVFQANRDTDNYKVNSIDDIEKLRPNKNSVKNSGAIAERSRVLLGTFRKKHYAELFFPGDPIIDTIDDITEILIMKQNVGIVGTLLYKFFPKITQFIPFIADKNKIKTHRVEAD